jgi:hypothetical protein
MSVMGKGFIGLVFWLAVGFGFTEVTVLTLNAWMSHGHQGPPMDTIAAIKADPSN